jgi:hypothetical protein
VDHAHGLGHCLQLLPEQEQIEALHVHVPDVWHVMLQVFPSQEQVLESVHVSEQPPVVDWHCATQLSEPLHSRLQGPVCDALQESCFGPVLRVQPTRAITTSKKGEAEKRRRLERLMAAGRATAVPEDGRARRAGVILMNVSEARLLPRMPHTAPAWLTMRRITVVALMWVPVAGGFSLAMGGGSVGLLGSLPVMLLGEWLAAWLTLCALGRSCDGVVRAAATGIFVQIAVAAGTLACIGWAATSGDPPRDRSLLLGLALMGGGMVGPIVGAWNAIVLNVAMKRPRASALNAPDRTVAVLGVLVALPSAAVSALEWTSSHVTAALAFALSVAVPLAAALACALRVWAWRVWLARVEANADPRWRLLATQPASDTRVLYAVDEPALPFREMERLTAVAFVERY